MEKLIEILFKKHYKDIYTYLYSLCHNTSISEDLASEVFLEILKSIYSYKGKSDIKTWMFSIAKHKWYNYLKKNNKNADNNTFFEYYDIGIECIEDDFEKNIIINRINEILNDFDERTRQIVIKRIYGYSFYDISKIFGISENSARVIDFRAKERIRNILKKEELLWVKQ